MFLNGIMFEVKVGGKVLCGGMIKLVKINVINILKLLVVIEVIIVWKIVVRY